MQYKTNSTNDSINFGSAISNYTKDVTPSYLRESIINNHSKLCEGIITTDGTFYSCVNLHADAVWELLKNGIDVKKAIRISNDADKDEITFSSLEYYYRLDEDLKKDKCIYISDEQANTLIDFYDSLKAIRNGKLNFKNILRASSNLGWELSEFVIPDPAFYSNVATEANIETLYKAIYKKYDLVKTPRRDLELDEDFIQELLLDNGHKRVEASKKKSKADAKENKANNKELSDSDFSFTPNNDEDVME